MTKIINRFDGSTIFEHEGTVAETVQAAIKARANLYGADLYGANLYGADLYGIKADVEEILAAAPAEVFGLLASLRLGRIDGTTYSGTCACLVGTIAKVRQCDVYEIEGLTPNAERPAEKWFLALKPGDTPANSVVAAITEGWIVGWMRDNGQADVLDVDNRLTQAMRVIGDRRVQLGAQPEALAALAASVEAIQ